MLSKRFEIMEKLYSSKTCLEMAGGGDASPTFSLDPPLLVDDFMGQFSLKNRSPPTPIHKTIGW